MFNIFYLLCGCIFEKDNVHYKEYIIHNNNSIFNKNNYKKWKETLKRNWIIIYTYTENEYDNKLTNYVRRATQLKYLTIENISNITVLLQYYNYDDY